jgi:2-oxoacid:acceptor oxidoreductase gamma subunit (pyruvate/2-ketoisovalerate family)
MWDLPTSTYGDPTPFFPPHGLPALSRAPHHLRESAGKATVGAGSPLVKPDGMSSLMERLERGEPIDLRGDGKAGGGLVLAVQAFGAALAQAGFDVQDWPLFSSARKGANVRAFLRLARRPIEAACQVTQPDIVVLMNEAAAREVDFAAGTREELYVINSAEAPEALAARYRLGGRVACVDGDALGMRHIGRPLGNLAVYAALVRTTGLVPVDGARASLEKSVRKRRLPERLIAANLALFDEALTRVRVAELPSGSATDHRARRFEGYGRLPVGAQAALRSARVNLTSGYGRPGVAIRFSDESAKCNGCSLCVVQCPEGIIRFTPDPARGAIVHGADFDDYCKVCRECVTACPLELFHEVAVVARPEGALHDA